MPSISIIELFTTLYVRVDDWYQAHGYKYLKGKVGKKPVFKDSEVITLVLAHDFIPYPAETQYVEFIRANYLALFPKLVDQSQFNRRARALRLLVEQFRRFWIIQKGWCLQTDYLLDTKPVPVVGYKRYKKHSDFAGHAEYGCCASRTLNYFGYKLVVLSTLNGIPLAYELVPPNLDERVAAEAVLDYLSNCNIFADKGFLGVEWQTRIFDQTHHRLWTPKRKNQHAQNSKEQDRWLSRIRERIEAVFHEVQNTGRNLERLLAKTVVGLCARIIAKMTSHLLRHLLRIDFGSMFRLFKFRANSTSDVIYKLLFYPGVYDEDSLITFAYLALGVPILTLNFWAWEYPEIIEFYFLGYERKEKSI